jgi:hypothetical protein
MRRVQPVGEFVGISKDAAAFPGNTMHGESAFLFPAANGALIASEKRRNFLPGINAMSWSRGGRHGQASTEMNTLSRGVIGVSV